MTKRVYQNLSKFVLPKNFRGRNVVYVQLWWLIQSLLFRNSPQFAYGFRVFLLRSFGAKIGKSAVIRPSVEITYPWRITLGDNCWIGDGVVLYSLGNISVGDNTVISQGSYLCAGDHDYNVVDFPIRGRDIKIGSEVWIATDVYVSPGITIGDGVVVGARSSVFKDLPAGWVCMGSPCRPIKIR